MPVTKTSSQGRNLHDNEFVGGFGHPSLWGSPPGMSCNGFGFGGLGDLLASLPRSALRVSGGGSREGRKPWSFKRSGSERMEAGGRFDPLSRRLSPVSHVFNSFGLSY